MSYKLQNGDYIKQPDNNDFQTIDYIDEIVQAVCLAFRAERETFYPNKNFGSHIMTAVNNKQNEFALVYARQAVDEIDGVYVKNAQVKNKTLLADLIINGIERSVSVNFENDI